MDAKLKLLLNSSAAIANEQDIYSVLIKLSNVTREILEADRASIFLFDSDKDELWTIVAHGISEIRIPKNSGIVGSVFQTKEPVNIKDAYNDPRFDPQVDKKSGYRTKSIISYPLINHNKDSFGVFQVINKKSADYFDEDDTDLLQHLSLFVSSALENAILMDKLKKANEDVIYRLSFATKFKDPETQNHIIRVGEFGKELASAIGMTKDEQELIRLASPMHDIGKVGVPDSILLKPGALTKDEWAVMQQHTEFGYDILKEGDSKLLQVAAIVSLEHHEKWDGNGYPNRKKGKDISLFGRITAISDVFDALCSKRVYKKAWTMEETIDHMKEQRNIHFDGELIDAFFDKIDAILKIKDEHKDSDEDQV